MDEYISREALLAEIAVDHGNWISYNDTDELYRQGVEDNYSDIRTLVKAMPAADVQSVKHGRWLKRMSTSDSLKCSVCGNNHEYETTYCPHCGRKMDGDAERRCENEWGIYKQAESFRLS